MFTSAVVKIFEEIKGNNKDKYQRITGLAIKQIWSE